MRWYATLALFVSCAAGQVAGAAEDRGQFEIRFGLVGTDRISGDRVISRETLEIPRADCHAGGEFGYSVVDRRGGRFSTRAVFYPPGPGTSIEEGISEAPADAARLGLSSKPSTYQVQGLERFCFHPADPLGDWTVEVWVNGQQSASFTVRVVPGDAAKTDR